VDGLALCRACKEAVDDRRNVYLGGREYDFLDVYDTTTGKVRGIGPLVNSVRPFTVNGSNTLAFTTATDCDGFQVSSITSGDVLFTVFFGPVPKALRSPVPVTVLRSRPTRSSYV
jgi:hypothetical protein